MRPKTYVNVIGAGLAGCEAALFLAKKNIIVNLFDMKPVKKSPAHASDNLAELVCSNSLKSEDPLTASGLLKEELKILDCELLKIAEATRVAAGGALAVDRELFSKKATEAVSNHPNINIVCHTVDELNLEEPTIIATGPLTDGPLYKHLMELVGGENCYFYDAIAPIIATDSIDMDKAFWGNRYGKGGEDGDYINCVLDRTEYKLFYDQLIKAERVKLKEFEDLKVFEGCMPVEILAERGFEALRFGPMKPIGLFDRNRDNRPYAVVQLRKEDEQNNAVNMVGFQTNLTYPEQKRIFGLIPALKNAEYIRHGSMHRNSFINAPAVLDIYSQIKTLPGFFVAGQFSGVEGYMESIASGLYAAYNMYRFITKRRPVSLPSTTCLGALMNHIANAPVYNFQPINANYGIIKDESEHTQKNEKRKFILENSLEEIKKFKEKIYEQPF